MEVDLVQTTYDVKTYLVTRHECLDILVIEVTNFVWTCFIFFRVSKDAKRGYLFSLITAYRDTSTRLDKRTQLTSLLVGKDWLGDDRYEDDDTNIYEKISGMRGTMTVGINPSSSIEVNEVPNHPDCFLNLLDSLDKYHKHGLFFFIHLLGSPISESIEPYLSQPLSTERVSMFLEECPVRLKLNRITTFASRGIREMIFQIIEQCGIEDSDKTKKEERHQSPQILTLFIKGRIFSIGGLKIMINQDQERSYLLEEELSCPIIKQEEMPKRKAEQLFNTKLYRLLSIESIIGLIEEIYCSVDCTSVHVLVGGVRYFANNRFSVYVEDDVSQLFDIQLSQLLNNARVKPSSQSIALAEISGISMSNQTVKIWPDIKGIETDALMKVIGRLRIEVPIGKYLKRYQEDFWTRSRYSARCFKDNFDYDRLSKLPMRDLEVNERLNEQSTQHRRMIQKKTRPLIGERGTIPTFQLPMIDLPVGIVLPIPSTPAVQLTPEQLNRLSVPTFQGPRPLHEMESRLRRIEEARERLRMREEGDE